MGTAREFEFIDPRTTPPAPIRCRGELPHLYKEEGSYFVTFRLYDAVVPGGLPPCGAGVPPARKGSNAGVPPARKGSNAGETPAPQHARKKMTAAEIAALSEPPLRLGACDLARPEIAMLVQQALRHFDADRYLLAAWCVMPNHTHAVFTPLPGHLPDDILHSWKSYTAHKANKLLGRKGTFWERESFDHLIRSIEEFEHFIRYVEDNPVAAGLCQLPSQWPYSSAFFRQEATREKDPAGGTPAPQSTMPCGASVPPAPKGTNAGGRETAQANAGGRETAQANAGGTPAPQEGRNE